MGVLYHLKNASTSLLVKESQAQYITNRFTKPEVTFSEFAAELSYDEQRSREQLEKQVERSFYEAGRSLKILRDRRLYRNTHETFEDYCKARFNYNRSRSYQLIDAATVVDNLQECPPLVDILPTTERQVRALVSLEAPQQRTCWQEAVEEAGGKLPSGKIVKSIVDKIRERTKIPIPYSKGEVCIIIPKDNPDLRGQNGCWCIVTSVHEFSCQVSTWDGEYLVKPENLKSLNLLENDNVAMQELHFRLKRLNNVENLDEITRSILKAFAVRTKPYLIPVQKKILELIEQEYKVI
ncbi:hypothetical protein NIES4071_46950 [Calothrix sp. NIES-4071]|nr:hypothetical protein NIES4071_46950 [Calothrix sp. NIES-4071]BAZ59006.1 hypothetical protein NIES4105_46880 [Calothrix sp. NIES-4105]